MNIHSLNFLSSFNRFSGISNHSDFRAEHHPKHMERKESDISLKPTSPDQKKIVNNELMTTLENALKIDSGSLKLATEEDFTPEKVADRVLGFVNQALGQLKNDQPGFDQNAFMEEIKKGIDQGFSEARDALKSLGALDGQIEENINSTYSLIQDGLAKFDGAAPKSVETQMQMQSFSAQMNQSTEVEVVTKEGDIIKISLSNSVSNSADSFSFKQEGLSVDGFQNSFSSNSTFNIEIEGNLNKKEQKDLKHLLKQMDKVGKDFFNGNYQAAFQHAAKIGISGQTIAGFSMNMEMNKSIQAVTAYQQTSLPDQTVQPDTIKQISDFFNQARELLVSAQSALEPLSDPAASFKDLFAAVNQLNINDSETERALPLSQIQDELVVPLSQSMF